MKAKVTFYAMPSNRVEVCEATTDAIEVTAQEMRALEILCSGACGFKDEHTLSFGLIEPSMVWDKIIGGDQNMKDTFMLDPDTADPITEDEFKEWFNQDYAELILERAADMLSGELSDCYFAADTFATQNADGDKERRDILPKSFFAMEIVER